MMMIRPRLSATIPLARALHSSASAAAIPRTAVSANAKATIQPATQSASLASGVLLGTQRNWKSETVVTLKSELKRRGLSQQGNKATLITRLENAEASASLVPTTPSTTPSSPARRLSTSASVQAAPSAPVSAAPSHPTPAAEPEHVVTTSGDQDVETPHLADPRPVTDATRVSAPGIPIKPNTVGRSFFNIKFPEPHTPQEVSQIIPSITSHITHKKAAPEVPKSSGPKVVTVASAATHPAGGPVAAAADVVDAHALEFDDPAVLNLDKQVEGAVSAAAEAVSNLVDVNLPPAPSKKESTYVANTEPLSEDERRGAWILVGGIAAVLALAGVGTGSKKEAKDVKEGDKEGAEKKN